MDKDDAKQKDLSAKEAELARREAALNRKAAEVDAAARATPATAVDPVAARNAAKKAQLKADTVKEGPYALYWIPEGGSMHYRQGVQTLPGNIVRIPIEEDPSITWEVVEKTEGAPILTPKEDKSAASPARPNDRGL